jgi:hypothetical protein
VGDERVHQVAERRRTEKGVEVEILIHDLLGFRLFS